MTTTYLSCAALALGALLAGACGEDTGASGAYGAQDAAPTPTMTDAGPFTDAASGDPDSLMGVWAQRQVTVSNVDVPVVGTTRTPTVSLLRVELTAGPTPDAFVAHQEICGIVVGSDEDPARTVIPDKFVAALPEVDRAVTLAGDGTYAVDWLTQVHGARLALPETDALPSAPDDVRVFDQDADGHPGLTVRITGLVDGEVYVVQRGRDRMVGRFADGRVDGLVEWTSEQVVLDADVELLRLPVPTRPEPEPEAHVFALRRLSSGTDCAAVLAEAETLFEP